MQIKQKMLVIAKLLHEAKRVLFITGAGISADSGLPTYRGIGGLYESKDTESGIPIEIALSGITMRNNPDLCWKYIAQIEAAGRNATFNDGHALLAQFERLLPEAWLLTQNVDGFHQAAGSKNLIEIHGNLRWIHCTMCHDRIQFEPTGEITCTPRCVHCSGVMRPEVVLFGEALPTTAIDTLQKEYAKGFDCVISIGTSSQFPYIAGPVFESAHRGLTTVEINPEETPVSAVVDFRLAMPATQALQHLMECYLHLRA